MVRKLPSVTLELVFIHNDAHRLETAVIFRQLNIESCGIIKPCFHFKYLRIPVHQQNVGSGTGDRKLHVESRRVRAVGAKYSLLQQACFVHVFDWVFVTEHPKCII